MPKCGIGFVVLVHAKHESGVKKKNILDTPRIRKVMNQDSGIQRGNFEVFPFVSTGHPV